MPAYAEEQGENVTGNSLQEICQDADLAMQGFCIGYIVGVVEGMRWGAGAPLLQADLQGDELEKSINLLLNFCLEESVTWGQYQDVVVQYIERHPEQRHISARLLSHLALVEAFPCASS